MSDLINSLELAKGQYTGIFSDNSATYWAAEDGDGRITCNRLWVQDWEWFSITKDQLSGKYLIKSDHTRKYVEVRDDGLLYASQPRPILTAQFDIDFDAGTIKSVSKKRYVNMRDGVVYADSPTPVPMHLFDLKTVAIADYDLTVYATPDVHDGKAAFSFSSSTPFQFVLISEPNGNASYLQSARYEYVKPINTIDPVSRASDHLDRQNFRLEITPVKDQPNIYTIKSSALNKYLQLVDTSPGAAKPKYVLYSNEEGEPGILGQFNMVLIN